MQIHKQTADFTKCKQTAGFRNISKMLTLENVNKQLILEKVNKQLILEYWFWDFLLTKLNCFPLYYDYP